MTIPLNGESAFHTATFPWIPGYKCFSTTLQFSEFSVSLISIRSRLKGVISEEFRLYSHDTGNSEAIEVKLPFSEDYEQVK